MVPSDLDFDDIYNEYHEKVLCYIQRMVGKNDAEDLTQEIFVKINNALHDFKGDSPTLHVNNKFLTKIIIFVL